MYNKGKDLARYNRTVMYYDSQALFLELLPIEIQAHIRKALKGNYIPAIRLNGTSDIRWELHNIPQQYPDIIFYDYTKFPLDKRR